MPRDKTYDRQGQRYDLQSFARKYPVLTKAASLTKRGAEKEIETLELEESVQALAHVLCRYSHAVDVTGMMLRLNNLLHDALNSMEYDANLSEKEEWQKEAEAAAR